MLSEMNLLDMCVQESLRMYPPAGRSVSVAISECDSTKTRSAYEIQNSAISSLFAHIYLPQTKFWAR